MKKLLLIMAVSACASVARAEYATYSYLARVDELGSDCTAATLSVYNAADNTVLSQNITSENFDTKGKAPSKSINFTSDETQPKTVYCIITTTTAEGDKTWKSADLAYSTDDSTTYYTPMYNPETYRQMSWTFGSNPTSNGWTVATVPEPTSGLLMLLGMAGLALRRRRA